MKKVDALLINLCELPFGSNKFDVLVYRSVLEYFGMFWLLFLEMIRAFKILWLHICGHTS